jgi:hypothetical protein
MGRHVPDPTARSIRNSSYAIALSNIQKQLESLIDSDDSSWLRCFLPYKILNGSEHRLWWHWQKQDEHAEPGNFLGDEVVLCNAEAVGEIYRGVLYCRYPQCDCMMGKSVG